MSHEVVILSACRTPIGRFLGSLSGIAATQLGALVIQEALLRAGLEGRDVNQVIMGNAVQGGLGQNPARQSALRAGLPKEVPAMTINMACGSGLKAVNLAVQAIALGESDVAVVGGMENMSRAPFLLPAARQGYRLGDGEIVDGLVKDGLTCAIADVHMGITAENVAERYGVAREMQDAYAYESQRRAADAIAAGKFKEEIVPVELPPAKGSPNLFDTDEHPRSETSLEALAALKPAFKPGGTVTAGNSSGINDGAAALVLSSSEFAQERGLEPLAVIAGQAAVGLDPAVMGMGPLYACKKALGRAGLTMDDVELVETNEAFAAQTLAVMWELGLDPAKTNTRGGAIALGHPIGASGARILVTLLHTLKQEGKSIGLATLCVGGGLGVAVAVKCAA